MRTALLPRGELVDGYCDLNRRCTSLRALAGPAKGRVAAKPKAVVLADVAFRVNPGGLARVRARQVRHVHAYARGRVVGDDVAAIRTHPEAVRVRYNPFLFDHFVRADTEAALSGVALLAIDGKTAWAIGPIPL